MFTLGTLISFSELRGLVLSPILLTLPTLQCLLQTVMNEFMGKAGMSKLFLSVQ